MGERDPASGNGNGDSERQLPTITPTHDNTDFPTSTATSPHLLPPTGRATLPCTTPAQRRTRWLPPPAPTSSGSRLGHPGVLAVGRQRGQPQRGHPLRCPLQALDRAVQPAAAGVRPAHPAGHSEGAMPPLFASLTSERFPRTLGFELACSSRWPGALCGPAGHSIRLHWPPTACYHRAHFPPSC